MCTGIRIIHLLLAVAPWAAESFVSQKRISVLSNSHEQAFLRKHVVVSDVSDEWWLDDTSGDSSSSSWDESGEDKFEVSDSKSSLSSQFLQGLELKQLRQDLESYRENLKWAEVMNDEERVISLKKEIEEQEKRDPEVVYNKARKLITEAESASRSVLKPDLKERLIAHWTEQRDMARECIPRFHMEGLWVGNYGSGPQLVNITYAGDTLVATKVTGDDTVPRGEVSFTANLSPPPLNDTTAEAEEELPATGEEHTVLQSKYGESIFPGQGQLAKKNFQDAKFISGVFIMYDTYRFSFSWVPTKHHVFFVRPSPHETIRLLRDVISKEDEVENMRAHLSRCFELDVTTSIAREHSRNQEDDDWYVHDEDQSFQRIKRLSDLEMIRNSLEMAENGQQGGNIFKFWRANKWKKYIDRVLGSDDAQDSQQ